MLNKPEVGPEDEDDPRAWVTNQESGQVSPIKRSEILGLDDWIENWPIYPERPSRVGFEGWQMVDDAHPTGNGRPAYRIVYKTIRTVVAPSLEINADTLRVSFANGPVTWGEPRFTNAIPDRREGDHLVPQWGSLRLDGDNPGYSAFVDRNVSIEAHQETTPDGNYVEIIVVIDEEMRESSHAEQIAAGRARVATLTASLDLAYGARLIGPILTEEVGEVFNDWHWNRRLGGQTVAMEGQARLEILDGLDLQKYVVTMFEKQGERDDEDRGRVRIASQWYWRADADGDPVMRFLGYWLCVEALELSDSANISPVKRRVASLLQVEQARIATGVGRLYGLRSSLAHGKVRHVNAESLDDVMGLAVPLLESRLLGTVSPSNAALLANAVLDR